MKSYKGDTLQVHTDFNWVEELALNRAVSIIIYFNPIGKKNGEVVQIFTIQKMINYYQV